MTRARVEVVTVERRRRWSRLDKERLVAASLEACASASEIARAADIHVSQLFRWRKQLCDRVATPGPVFDLAALQKAPMAIEAVLTFSPDHPMGADHSGPSESLSSRKRLIGF